MRSRIPSPRVRRSPSGGRSTPRRPIGPAAAGDAVTRDLRTLLDGVAAGRVPVETALQRLAMPSEEALGFATLDHHRVVRKGFPEVVFCQGKTPEQAAEILARLAEASPRVLATRAGADHALAARQRVPGVEYDATARVLWVDAEPDAPRLAGVAIVAAGTSDLPVAEEAARTLQVMGHEPARVYDVGVAGLHRLVRHAPALATANVVIVVAGMEGALPSVVGGLVPAPVIAVPTSVGYGASFGGLAALLGMLNSCAPGVAVVNIDNGFGAGYLAAAMNRRMARSAEAEART